MTSNIKPNKLLGQNFLVDKNAVKKIIDTAELSKDDIVLEIGPGTGILTRELLKKAKEVAAVEKDRKMAEELKENLKDFKNLKIITGDILKTDNLDFKKYKIVANIPYYITSPIIRKFLEASFKPEIMVLTIQKEVAQRICAKPPDMNLLAVSVQFYSDVKIVSYILKSSFWPKPKVDSAIIKITPFGQLKNDSFFRIVKAGFRQPRKQIINNMASGLKMPKEKAKELLLKAGIKPEQRPETLSVQNWLRLTEVFML